ncbi:MAG: hypothetical protein LBG84_08050 [Treponema sp.]|jgi:hypothetical protein|nr:hypothetical protein [Treponema sp.]
MDAAEIQDELFHLEYPYLLPNHDPDIERYFYLRAAGRAQDALAVYQHRLRVRYPNDEFRTWLLRCYRNHDPAFPNLLARGYRMLGIRSLERIKRVLLVIAEKAESYNEKDLYSTIKTAEDMLQLLPRERYEAMAMMDRLLRYAAILDIKVRSITRAAGLVSSYLTDSLPVVAEERRRRSQARLKAEEEERRRRIQADWPGREGSSPPEEARRYNYRIQKQPGVRQGAVDLSTVVFSPQELTRMEIPAYPRVEDQVLGYCFKYWYMVNDPSFEKALFLYSRKYGKRNHDVFMIIRRGRRANHRDEEILASVMGILITGYYYSMQGDRYLQRNWKTLKTALDNQRRVLPPSARKKAKEGGLPGARKPAALPAVKTDRPAIKLPGIPVPPPAAVREAVQAKLRAAPPAARGAGPAPRRAAGPVTKPPVKAAGSVSDRLRELSGRSYDLYQERFLAKARPAIRKVFAAKKGLLFNLPEEAENLVYAFLKDHYSDPFMDWENSGEKKKLLSMGFDLPSLNLVIDECYRAL